MNRISLPAAITLTEWSERTFFRKFAEGALSRETVNGRVTIPYYSLQPHLCLGLLPEDIPIIESADAGDAQAQNELALIFLSADKPKGAIYWLELAAKQDYADAMSLLSDCYLKGKGVPKDENIGVMWLAKAASLSHFIAQGQMQAVRNQLKN